MNLSLVGKAEYDQAEKRQRKLSSASERPCAFYPQGEPLCFQARHEERRNLIHVSIRPSPARHPLQKYMMHASWYESAGEGAEEQGLLQCHIHLKLLMTWPVFNESSKSSCDLDTLSFTVLNSACKYWYFESRDRVNPSKNMP